MAPESQSQSLADAPSGRRRWWPALCLAGATAASLPLVAGFFGAVHPAFDAVANLRLHLAGLVGVLALPLLATRLWQNALVSLALAGLAIWSVSAWLPVLSRSDFAARDPERASYRLLQLNLRYDNRTPERVLSLIGRERPDVLTLDEVSDMWKARLEPLAAAYPYRIVCPFPNGVFGVAILSRRPFFGDSEPRCLDRGAFAVARIDFGGQPVEVAALHLGWPWPFEQPEQLQRILPRIGELGPDSLVAGDFNAVPWSHAPLAIALAGGLSSVPPVGPTWLHRALPRALRFAGLPIDHVLAKGGIAVTAARTLDSVGSDHWPVLVEFSVAPPLPEGDEAISETVMLERGGSAQFPLPISMATTR